MMVRHLLLRGLCLGLSLALSLPAGAVCANTPSRQRPPNIVLIVVDDLRFDELGVLNPVLKTPNLNRLAKEGVRFANAFVTTSLCSPSRATILTGQSARNHHIVGNELPEPAGTRFFPGLLQQAGYRTAMIGKWHMGQGDAPRPGFDHWVSFAGQGVYLPDQGPGGHQMLNIDGKPVPQKGYITDELTDYALDWLGQEQTGGKPFFLYLAHKAVHEDFTPATRHEGQYKDLPAPTPATQADTAANNDGKPRWVRTQRNSWHGVDYAYYGEKSLDDLRRRYAETLSAVDDSVGRLLSWLKETGQERDTIILFMSDNGFLFGEHGLIDKRNAYEPSIRVPLLAYAPGRFPAGGVVGGMVANLDVAPTVLDLAGVPAPADFEGRSFRALAEGKPAGEGARQELIYEYYWEFALPHTPTTFAIRTDRYKYIYYHGVWEPEELYDLSVDPDETRNLAARPDQAALKQQLRERLFAALRNREGERVIPFDAKNRDGRIYRSRDGAPQGEFPPEWLRP
ncbi:sulfatase [Niveispirillum sp.]|uniref:sulfatase family protein n=1 Tax=Niveispirillum sp. TaxID=1917217 RepID=UPI001B3E083D|nr:sulfatase [Niveispirillum sp.]MBP7339747.1 sulfatase [Niveispirillum sp.]